MVGPSIKYPSQVGEVTHKEAQTVSLVSGNVVGVEASRFMYVESGHVLHPTVSISGCAHLPLSPQSPDRQSVSALHTEFPKPSWHVFAAPL